MPRQADSTPTDTALRKRAQRARLVDREGADAVKAKAAAYARERRAKLKAAAIAAEPADAPAAVRREVNAARNELVAAATAALREALEQKQPMAAALPAVFIRTKDIVSRVKAQVAQKANAEHLVETLHSTDPEEKEVSRKSLTDYVIRLLFLQKMITGRKSATLDLNLFRDTPRVLKAIEAGISASGATKGQPWALATKLVYWGALSGVLRRLESYEDAHAVYSAVLKQRHSVYEEDRKTNLSTPSEKNRFVPWPQLRGLFFKEARAAPDQRVLSPRDMAIFALYVAIPPRRVLDYQEMRIAAGSKKKAVDVAGLSKASNWLVLSKTGVPTKLVISRYKTTKRYGTYVLDELPRELVETLQYYIQTAKLGGGEPLFPTASGKPFTAGGFSNLVGQLFLDLTGRRASVNILRHSAITHFLSAKRTVAEREAFAKQMAHSVALQSLYERVDAGETPEEVADSVEELDGDDLVVPAKPKTAAPRVPAPRPPAKTAAPTPAPLPPALTTTGRPKKAPSRFT